MEIPTGITQYIVGTPGTPAAHQQFFPAAAAPATLYAPAHAKSKSHMSTGLIIVAIVILLVYLYARSRKMRPLAKLLAERGWILYTKPGCGYCTKQLEMLGVREFPAQVECGKVPVSSGLAGSLGPVPCSKVKGFPFWINKRTGATRAGLQDKLHLVEML